jgi:CheY-like chemotaxis protein
MASSAKQAIDILSNKHLKFDLVLTDMQMPEMDGLGLAKYIREKFPLLPILLLSSLGDERAKHHENLFNAVLTKPVKQQVLHKHILSQLRNGREVFLDEPAEKRKLSTLFATNLTLRRMAMRWWKP